MEYLIFFGVMAVYAVIAYGVVRLAVAHGIKDAIGGSQLEHHVAMIQRSVDNLERAQRGGASNRLVRSRSA